MMSPTRVDAVFPQEQGAIPEERSAIPEERSAIPEERSVIPDSIRDPVPQHPWIAGQARNDRSLFTLVHRCRESCKHQ